MNCGQGQMPERNHKLADEQHEIRENYSITAFPSNPPSHQPLHALGSVLRVVQDTQQIIIINCRAKRLTTLWFWTVARPLSTPSQLAAGSAAAIAAWLVGYPADVLKTRCQMLHAGTSSSKIE